jgi:tripartite-type tricarboxylate transporter receptor subunit TctC
MHRWEPRAVIALLVLLAGATGDAAGASSTGSGAAYPSRPIRYVVAFAPGGINDILARIVGQKLNESWGHSVIVDNRPGAGGNLAASMVAKSTPDGYTFMNISTAHTISQTLYKKLDYSLERDLAPVVVLGNSPLIMVVNAGIPAKNVADLVDWARKNRLIYASGGVGVISHLAMEMFKTATKIDATHVPYKGVGPAVPDLISGQAHVMVNAIPELLPHTKGGRLRVIGSMTEKRHPFIPDVPTFIEQGHKEFVMGNWTGIVAPAGTPRATINKIAAEVTRILRVPEMTKRLVDMGVDPMGGTPEEFGRLIKSEVARFGVAVKASGATAD